MQAQRLAPAGSIAAEHSLSAAAEQSQSSSLDGLREALEKASAECVQEKVYVHTDNNQYFIGDTLWYKAYVVRADNLHFTDMSRILYVELLTPDGILVERQQIIVSDRGFSNGNFHLTDSLYSGYYELRAYTRWMLNFNVSQKEHSRNDDRHFYSYAMADDYYRTWDGLYSRVFPVYERPAEAGDYEDRAMISRPKERATKVKKPELNADFYPEGGHLIMGVSNRVAFELTDQYGAAVDEPGVLMMGDRQVATVKPDHMGRGVFSLVPKGNDMKAIFSWNGKRYTFRLPEAEAAGVALALEDSTLRLTARNLPADGDYALSILCRGALQHFQPLELTSGETIEITLPPLPTGVNNVTVFASGGQILADRLFFVNNHDYDDDVLAVDAPYTTTYQPHQRVDIGISYPAAQEPMLLSVSVRDQATDGDSYDDGNIMTDLLLSSELKGFVANPAYYFAEVNREGTPSAANPSAASAEERAKHLDLLMMVQGWRKYDWTSLLTSAGSGLRYAPETSMTVEGGVYKMYAFEEVNPNEIPSWANGMGLKSYTGGDDEISVTTSSEGVASTSSAAGSEGSAITVSDVESVDVRAATAEQTPSASTSTTSLEGYELVELNNANVSLGVNHGNLRKEVYVEAELFMGDQYAGSVQLTHNNGRFIFELPPYYGVSIFNMKAYAVEDSLKKNMLSRQDAKIFDESAVPDYYVKRDLFYPVFTQKYDYYQTHLPQIAAAEYIDTTSLLSMENDVHELQNVNVKGRRRRSRRAIDYDKPAIVRDAYEVYNEMTDRGLSWGMYDMRMLPIRVAQLFYGNMNRYTTYNVAGRNKNYTYSRNFRSQGSVSGIANADVGIGGRTHIKLMNDLRLKRLKDVRLFSDFEPRNDDVAMEENQYMPDVTVDLVNIPDEGKQLTYRDRHIMLPGFNEPAQFYHRDYTNSVPSAPTDYRRTLYWNPNVRMNAEGKCTISFFNNSKETRVKITAAGITSDGKLVRF